MVLWVHGSSTVHHAVFSILGDNTMKINILRKINLLCYRGHLDEKYDALSNNFRDCIHLI